jgi:hypothetical protein
MTRQDAAALAGDWEALLRENAAGFARTAIDNIGREYPSLVFHLMTGPDDVPGRPRDRSPVFFGSLDWHSCVEMHWLLVRLLRLVPDAAPGDEIRALLDVQFEEGKLAAEAAFVASRDGRHERPYGWAWALALVQELDWLNDPDAARWLEALAPLEAAVVDGFLEWLPKATYPNRHGVHGNTAFAFSQLLPCALERSPGLADAVTAKALDWYTEDAGYAAQFEPSGHDFLSPALTEAELVSRLLGHDQFSAWLARFLPGIENGEPETLFTPAVVSDASEGQIAHLHGLNASRAWCWRRLAESLPPADPRVGPALAAARSHLDAALPHVTGSDYMVEHWLAAYAVLALS